MKKPNQIRMDLVASILFLAFAIFMIAYAIPTQINVKGFLQGSSSESRLFPYFACYVIGISALIEIIVCIVQLSKCKKEEGTGKRLWPEIKALIIFALIIVYTLLFSWIGYIPSTLIIAPIALFVMGGRKWQHYLAVESVGVIMYFVFVYVLKVALP